MALDITSVPLWFAVLDTLSPPPNPTCTDVLLHLACGAVAPPCDPSTQRALPICKDSCRAYKHLLSDGKCDDLYAFVERFAAAQPVPDAQATVDLYFSFDCDNTSTYLFGSHLDFASPNKCTNITSSLIEGRYQAVSDNDHWF